MVGDNLVLECLDEMGEHLCSHCFTNHFSLPPIGRSFMFSWIYKGTLLNCTHRVFAPSGGVWMLRVFDLSGRQVLPD